MKTNLLRAGALSCALLASTALVSPAMAQDLPRFNETDANGVDLVNGRFSFSLVEGSIGSGEGALVLSRNWSGSYQTDNWSGAAYLRTIGGTQYMVVEFGTYSDTFTISGGTYTSTKANGATLDTVGGLRYRTSDGTTIMYSNTGPDLGYPVKAPQCSLSDDGTCWLPVSVTRPNGMIYTMNWEVLERCLQYDAELNCINANAFYRWRGVQNSANYKFTVNYVTNTPGSGVPQTDWYVRSNVQFTNLDTAPGTLPTVSYARPSTGVLEVTDIGGQVWRFASSGNGLTGIRRPGAGSDTTTIAYSGSNITVTREGVATSYAFSSSGSTGTTTITDANSEVTTVVSDLIKGRVTSVTDPLSRTTGFTYDSNSRLTRVTQDEGNYVAYTYDARGNVTETRAVAKSGTGLPDMVTSASYDSSCSNLLTCNRPNSTTDARGFRTDYSWDSTHGGLLTVTQPAPGGSAPVGSGDRPQTRYSWTQVTAVSGQPVHLLTGVSACASGTVASSCVGTANESRAVIAWDTDNLRATSVTARNGDNSVSATTAYSYDAIGNALTADGPLSGTADTIRYRYDAARRVIGVVGPDPDGGGSLKHRAVRTTYTNGLATSSEQGTVNSQSDGDWAAFAPLQRIEQDYDANARPTVQRQMSGSTTYALTEANYDGLGRVRCVAQRMNPSEFATAGSDAIDACTADTPGSYGADRISRMSYDDAGQMTKVETGVDVSGMTADEATTTYSDNGLPLTVTDANGNKTTYVYDGHDRLSQTRMPHPSTTGTSNSSDYEELTYATAIVGGNTVSTPLVSSRRLRDNTSIAYSYDNLSRVTARDIPGTTTLDPAYGYDLLSRMTSASYGGTSWTFTFDALGRRLTEVSPWGTLTSTWDEAGRRTRLNYGGGLYVDYDYNVAGDTTAIRENGATSGAGVLGTYAWDDRGRRTSLTRGNGTVTSYGYDDVSRLNSLTQNLNGTGSDVTYTYSHNPAGEIVSTTRSNDTYAWTGHATGNIANTINGRNQVTATGGSSVSHDSRGNVTAIGTQGFGYTPENRLSHGPNSTSYAWDPLGRLYFAGTASGDYLQSEGDTIAAELGSGAVLRRRYVHGPGIDEPLVWYEGSGTSDRRWFHADERGSVVAVSDGSGNLTGGTPNRYDEYGAPQGTLTGRFGYTGQAWLPDAGLYHYRNRAYNPALGRFMQTDPIGFGGGMNWYAYVGNNPVNFTDPLGLDEEDNDITVTGRCPRGTTATSNGGCTQNNRDLVPRVGQGIGSLGSWLGGVAGPAPRPQPRPQPPRPRPAPPPPPTPPTPPEPSLFCRIADSFVTTGEIAVTAGTVALATPAAVSGAGVAAGGVVSMGVGSTMKRIGGC